MKRYLRLFVLCFTFVVVSLLSIACGIRWTAWEVEQEPNCTEKGIESRHVEGSNDVIEYRDIDALGHDYEDWEIVIEPTHESCGLKRRICERCGNEQEEEIPQLDYTYLLTCEDNGVVKSNQYIGEDGAYELILPERVGFEFVKFIDTQNGEDFALCGHIDHDVVVSPIWQILPTDNFDDLKTRIENGATKIWITADIELTDTVFIDHSVDLYCNKNVTLTRSENFGGFLFVVGKKTLEDNIDINAVGSVVNLYTTDNARLVFDGNKENVVDVYGSAFFVTNSCTVNLEKNVIFQNFKKTYNRLILYRQKVNHFAQVGGACFIIGDTATVNINGSEIINNETNTDATLAFEYPESETRITDEEGYLDEMSCSGGAIWNNGTLNIYQGTFANNIALKGAAIFNYKYCNIYGGTFANNIAESHGGVIYLPASQKSELVIGEENNTIDEIKVYFNANVAKGNGGVIFGQTVNSILINGGVKFYQNSSTANGGAISTSGSLTIKNSLFEANNGLGSSSKGGAIYSSVQDNEKTARQHCITNCQFIANTSAKGGALGCYAPDTTEKFVTIFVTDCSFITNEGSEGGAIWLTGKTHATLNGCEFNQNTATTNGGVMYITGASDVSLADLEATDNTAQKGGVIYITTTNTILKILSGRCSGNTAVDEASGNTIWYNTNKVKIYIKGITTGGYFTYEENGIKGSKTLTIGECDETD